MTRRGTAITFLAVLAVAGVLDVANLYFGPLNQDEGWYLYAARLVSNGLQPYRDFAFTQAPVMPFVYAVAQPLVDQFGLAGGRLFTSMLGFATALFAGVLASRLVAKENRSAAALLALILILVNVYQSYFTTAVKTYALCGLFLTGGLLLLVLALERRSPLLCFAAAVFMTLAAGTRISAGAGLAVAFVFLLFQRNTFQTGWLAFAAGGALAAMPVFLRWYLTAPDGFIFGVFEYHAARSAGSLAQALVYKAGFISRVVQAYFVAAALAAALVLWCLLHGRGGAAPELRRPARLAWAVVGAITLVHFIAPVPYDDYQALVYPLFGAALAAALVQRVTEVSASPRTGLSWLTLTVFGLCLAAAFSSPINQNWFVRGQDRIWWRLRENPALAQLQKAAAWVRQNSKPGDRILTQDIYLAVESGRRVPSGLEMGPFSYFPDMPKRRAKRLHVMNRAMMARLVLAGKFPVVALSGYSFAISSPIIEETSMDEQQAFRQIIDNHYEVVERIPFFGQGETELLLYKPK